MCKTFIPYFNGNIWTCWWQQLNISIHKSIQYWLVIEKMADYQQGFKGRLFITSGYPWRSDTIRPCLQARVAAFGSQDLGFRTSIFGSQDLGFRTSINGHWVSLSGPGFQDLDRRTDIGRRKVSILRSSYLFPVTFLCVQWSQTDRQTDATSDFIYKIDL
jgi:hypothetical protein